VLSADRRVALHDGLTPHGSDICDRSRSAEPEHRVRLWICLVGFAVTLTDVLGASWHGSTG